MAFPAEGIETVIRNKLTDVSNLLDLYHKDHYCILNASNRKYDFTKFKGEVISVAWPNHYPCPFTQFTEIVVRALEYLSLNDKNVIVVHCLAGKGRTGSIISAILYASGNFSNVKEANVYYGMKRNVKVTYASQLRYLEYFEKLYRQGKQCLSFKPRIIDKITFSSKRFEFYYNNILSVKVIDFEHGEILLS